MSTTTEFNKAIYLVALWLEYVLSSILSGVDSSNQILYMPLALL